MFYACSLQGLTHVALVYISSPVATAAVANAVADPVSAATAAVANAPGILSISSQIQKSSESANGCSGITHYSRRRYSSLSVFRNRGRAGIVMFDVAESAVALQLTTTIPQTVHSAEIASPYLAFYARSTVAGYPVLLPGGRELGPKAISSAPESSHLQVRQVLPKHEAEVGSRGAL